MTTEHYNVPDLLQHSSYMSSGCIMCQTEKDNHVFLGHNLKQYICIMTQCCYYIFCWFPFMQYEDVILSFYCSHTFLIRLSSKYNHLISLIKSIFVLFITTSTATYTTTFNMFQMMLTEPCCDPELHFVRAWILNVPSRLIIEGLVRSLCIIL